jgi:hypothetical protein
MGLQTALKIVTDELKNDKEFRQSWVANIAMAYKDTRKQYQKKAGKKFLNLADDHIISNDAAEHFIKLLCDEYPEQPGH